MVLRLVKIPTVPLAQVLAIFHSVIGLIVGVVITLGALFNQGGEGIWGLGAWALVLLPLLNGALGFLTGLFIAGCYNAVMMAFDKGIELEFDQLDNVTLK